MSDRLPQAARLQVPEEKILGYLLNPQHKDGAAKDRFFRRRGLRPEAWEEFAAALRQHGATQQVTERIPTKHGAKFVVECHIPTPDGKNPCILSVWIKVGSQPPRLVTAHPNL